MNVSPMGSAKAAPRVSAPNLGPGALRQAARLAEKREANAAFYKAVPIVTGPRMARPVHETRPNTPPGANESVFSQGKKYAGERGGRRVYREKGKTRRFVLRVRNAREAILSALAAETAVAEVLAPVPAEAAPAPKPARKPRAKKAVSK